MNNEKNPDNVFKPKKTPLMIGAVLLVLIIAIIVLAVFLLTRDGDDDGSGTDTDPITTTAATSDPVLSVPDTTEPAESTGGDPATEPETDPATDAPPAQTTAPAIPTIPDSSKEEPNTFSKAVKSEDIGRGALILVDELVRYNFPVDKLIGRSAMAGLSTTVLKSEYNFVKVPSGNNYHLKDGNLFLNTDASAAFVDMMNAFTAATGNTDVQLRNAYYYDTTEQVCYNATGLYVDLEINLDGKIYPLNYETMKAGYYDWFIANSYRYGYIHVGENLYANGEPRYSSFRYVGIPHATYMTKNGVDLEDYLNMLKSYTNEKMYTYSDDSGTDWLIYYVPATAETTEISVYATSNPNSYSISGNNLDGFIVTVNTGYFKLTSE